MSGGDGGRRGHGGDGDGASGAGDGLRVLIVSGGTGGHVYPALAVARRLLADGHGVAWLGTRRGLEARVVPAAGIPLHFLRVSGLRGKGAGAWLLAPLRLALALAQALRVVRAVRPDAVLGMGGFVAGPAGIAAWLARAPLLVHEQNAIPGATNRVLARFAVHVMEAFPGSFPARVGAEHTGNPVREDIAALPLPEDRLAGRDGRLRVLVLGGSQGARVLNEIVPAAAASAGAGALELYHQAGDRNLERARACYAAAQVDVRLVAYIEDVAEAYRWADLVVCRAGAMTVAELAAAGAASILVPYPHAVDDHQWHNARYLSEAGAALLVRQAELTVERLARVLADLAGTRERIARMARAARRLAVPDAAERVAARVTATCAGVARA